MGSVLARNYINIIGEGEQTIILAHGFGCNQKMWQYMVPYFEENYRLVLFDYVGSGHSDLTAYESEKYSTLHGYATDLLEIIDELKLEDVIFVGHSISSMIGMLAAIEQPQHFKHLVMISPSPCYLNDTNGYKGGFEKSDIMELLDMMEMNFVGWASHMAPMAMQQDSSQDVTQELEQYFVSSNPRIAREFAEVTFFSDYRGKLDQLQIPTLILQCAEDSIVPIEVGYYLHEHLEKSEIITLNAKGHYPHISQPTETAEKILKYLNTMSENYAK